VARLVIGNWKMNTTREDAIALARGVVDGLGGDTQGVGVGIAPPFPFLDAVRAVVEGSPVELVAQSCHANPKGAHTGETSVAMLASVGVQRVIVGHSERRAQCAEDDAVVRAKIQAVLDAGLRPVVCVGETLEERESGRHEDVVRRMVTAALDGLSADERARLAIAYEPVWAIGTGKTASPEQAGSMHQFIGSLLGGDDLPILYGGSVKPSNIHTLAQTPGIDGALVGGASLDPDSFIAIVRGAAEVS